MTRFIAFDWGKSRTGIAVTDSSAIIATPYSTTPTTEIHSEIKKLLETEPCAGFVIGVPGLITGSSTDSSKGIEKFIESLKVKYHDVPTHLIDESHTSSEALNSLHLGGMKKSERKKKGSLDKVAAALILQRFLETV